MAGVALRGSASARNATAGTSDGTSLFGLPEKRLRLLICVPRKAGAYSGGVTARGPPQPGSPVGEPPRAGASGGAHGGAWLRGAKPRSNERLRSRRGGALDPPFLATILFRAIARLQGGDEDRVATFDGE